MATLELDGVSKVYDDAQGTERAVDDVSMTVPDGEFAVLVGPSGCGKTTTLRMVAGLEPVTEGRILMGGREVHRLAPSERDVAMVFQSYALYPKMTGRENIAYGLKHAMDLPAEERAERVREAADLLDITDVLDDPPAEMSGGQQQRVALGRAIVREPDVFLLDEPLSNLDAKLRSGMRRELQRIHDELGITTLYVTHDQKEAMTMADRIGIMADGRLQQVAPPEAAYEQPANRFVGEFLGSPSMNTLEVTLERGPDAYAVSHDGWTLADVPAESVRGTPEAAVAGVRPEDLRLVEAGAGRFDARVIDAEYQGNTNFVFLEAGDLELTARTPRSVRPDRGDTVGVTTEPEAVYLFDARDGESLRAG